MNEQQCSGKVMQIVIMKSQLNRNGIEIKMKRPIQCVAAMLRQCVSKCSHLLCVYNIDMDMDIDAM